MPGESTSPSWPARAIVAEDDAEMRALVADALRLEGFAIDEVADGRRLWLSTLRSGPYDLVVSDVRLPIVDGLTVIEDLRQRERRLGVVLMSAFGDDTLRARAASLGAVFLDKPFPLSELRTAARRLCERHRSTRSSP